VHEGYGQLSICTQPYEQLSQADALVIPFWLSGRKKYVDVTLIHWLGLVLPEFCPVLPSPSPAQTEKQVSTVNKLIQNFAKTMFWKISHNNFLQHFAFREIFLS
jgi:hypothetical protein